MKALLMTLALSAPLAAVEYQVGLVLGEIATLHLGPFDNVSAETPLSITCTCAKPQVRVDANGRASIDLSLAAGSRPGAFTLSIIRPTEEGEIDGRTVVAVVDYTVTNIEGIPAAYSIKGPGLDGSSSRVQDVVMWTWAFPGRRVRGDPMLSEPSWSWAELGFSASISFDRTDQGKFQLSFQRQGQLGGRVYLDIQAELPMVPGSELVTRSSVHFERRIAIDIRNDLVATWKRRSIQLDGGVKAVVGAEICTLAKPGMIVHSVLLGACSEEIQHSAQVTEDGILTIDCRVRTNDTVNKKTGAIFSTVDVVHAAIDLMVGDEPLRVVVPIILVN